MIWMIKFLYISKYRKNIKNTIIFIANLWMICKIIICCMYVNVYCKALYTLIISTRKYLLIIAWNQFIIMLVCYKFLSRMTTDLSPLIFQRKNVIWNLYLPAMLLCWNFILILKIMYSRTYSDNAIRVFFFFIYRYGIQKICVHVYNC